MSYTLIWADTTKPNIIVSPGMFDTASTSLTLSGKGALNYGESQQTNFIRLLENFASPTAPAHPTRGQIWYNTNTSKLNVWTGTTWNSSVGGGSSGANPPVGAVVGDLWWNTAVNRGPTSNISQANAATTSGSGLNLWTAAGWTTVFSSVTNSLVTGGSQVKVAYIDEYNYFVNKYNKVAGTPSGTTFSTAFGYGQTPVPLATTTLSNADWKSLLAKIKAVTQHQGLSSGISDGVDLNGFIYEAADGLTSGIATKLGWAGNGTTIANRVGTYATSLFATDNLEASRFAAVVGSLETSSPSSGTRARSAAWNNTVTHEVYLQFVDFSRMKAYFNSGGKVSFNITVPNSPSTQVNQMWNEFLATIGSVTFAAGATSVSGTGALGTTSKGLYDLSTNVQTIFTRSASAAYSQETLAVTAVLESNNTVLHFTVSLTSSGTVTATTTSSVVLTKASETFLNSPEMSYPTISSLGNL